VNISDRKRGRALLRLKSQKKQDPRQLTMLSFCYNLKKKK
jgi:hypothetical protein